MHVIAVMAMIVVFVVILVSKGLGALVALGIFITALWAILATTIRRLRDAGLSTWWILATFVPYVGTVATIVFGCVRSNAE